MGHDFAHAPLYVHLDMDIVNPQEVPAMNYTAVGGPSANDMHTVLAHLKKTQKIAAVSVSTWNPDLDHDHADNLVWSLVHQLKGLDDFTPYDAKCDPQVMKHEIIR